MRTHHELKLYGGRYLAFGGSFLSNSTVFLTEDQKRPSQIMRETSAATFKPGMDPISHMHKVERRALAAIERDGIEAFIKAHTAKEPA